MVQPLTFNQLLDAGLIILGKSNLAVSFAYAMVMYGIVLIWIQEFANIRYRSHLQLTGTRHAPLTQWLTTK